MLNEKKSQRLIRTLLFAGVAAIHLVLIFFLAFNAAATSQEPPEFASVMKLTDLAEFVPPPPVEEEIRPTVESIAETMIETDTPPAQNVLAAGVFLEPEVFLPAHQLSTAPQFDVNTLLKDLVYPPIALRSGIEGRVILELFVDRTGLVQRIEILQETPTGRGFGEAAIKLFTGRVGTPATANGEAVSARYRYPVTFRIR